MARSIYITLQTLKTFKCKYENIFSIEIYFFEEMYFYIFICQRRGDSHHPGGHQDGGQEAGAGDQQQHQQPEVPLQGVPLTRPGVQNYIK